ncbi:Sec-independent protein translocase protein TatB [Sphingomonas bacterium]|uniref:Sec-independent protein translocase protein TatB n=1 Tax=Sphingomonas bacterium TaxID=1895847 RepID=UPI001575F0F8|nr:Sec-independent protein translocase protein TatB [Sphingomonas bacterium]
MFDIAPSEFLLVAFVALIVIGPKDLPKAMRIVGYWVGKARGVARQFRSGFDEMVREAELEEMEKRWATENERIMREHPQPAIDQPAIEHSDDATPVAYDGAEMKALPSADGGPADDGPADGVGVPVHVERPVVAPAPVADDARSPKDGAPS